jgi:dsDNA-specific endonuclease/ATPase MutS2
MSGFESLLNEYKSNYTQFLSTGNPAYKTAYMNAQEAIDKAILERQDGVEDQKRDMKRFAESYQEGNSELSDIYDSATGLFKNAQQIEDTYLGAKRRYDQTVAPGSGEPALNVANGYAFILRFGLILIILPVLFFIGYWSPEIKAAVTAVTTAASAMPSPVLGPTRA